VSKIDDLIAAATGQVGVPYAFGQETPGVAFDCSGLTQYAYAQVGVRLPRTAAEQQDAVARVSSPQPGDLVFWGDPAEHVALYIGKGKSVAAPQPGESVKVQDVWGTPTYGRVSSVGGAIASTTGAIGNMASDLTSVVSDTLGQFRGIILTGLAVGLGLALVGTGVYTAVARPLTKRVRGAALDVGKAMV
jgi:hypothetical protein